MPSDPDFSYGRHLRLEQILDAVAPVSDSHDEILFIIQHQTSELWFRLVIAELDAARLRLSEDDLRGALKALKRVTSVLRHLVGSWDVLRHLEPRDFLNFRGQLGEASGFQSWQYRLVEFALGNRETKLLEAHRGHPERMALFEAELARPSIYQMVLKHLSKHLDTELPVAAFALDRPYRGQPEVLTPAHAYGCACQVDATEAGQEKSPPHESCIPVSHLAGAQVRCGAISSTLTGPVPGKSGEAGGGECGAMRGSRLIARSAHEF